MLKQRHQRIFGGLVALGSQGLDGLDMDVHGAMVGRSEPIYGLTGTKSVPSGRNV